MRSFLKVAVIIIATFSLSSCAICGLSTNPTANINNNQTNVTLATNNYHVVKTVEASVSATYILGIGGLGQKALHDNAVAELTKKANLTGSQALINVTVKQSTELILVYRKVTYYAEGTIIQFDN